MEYKEAFDECLKEGKIRSSNQTFKIRLFMQKAENSLLIAKDNDG